MSASQTCQVYLVVVVTVQCQTFFERFITSILKDFVADGNVTTRAAIKARWSPQLVREDGNMSCQKRSSIKEFVCRATTATGRLELATVVECPLPLSCRLGYYLCGRSRPT